MLKLSRFALVLAGVASVALAQTTAPTPEEARLLRFPTVSDKQIVFSYSDQLYSVGLDGGVARRLTDAPGYALFPRFSRDGSQLAFTAQYDGNTEVYVMAADGGAPKRLTYTATLGRDDLSDRMGPNNIVMGWDHADHVVFRSRLKTFNDFNGSLFSVGLDAELPKQLPVPIGGFLSMSPDDSKMAYNRIFREFRTWKDYRGGMADEIWIFDFKTGALENITNNPAQDIIPMWAPNGKVYFLSDRDGRLNLFSYDLSSKATVQYTHFKDFDIKFPSLGTNAIVFENAGALWYFDLKSGTARQVPVQIKEDGASTRPALMNVAKWVESAHPSPDGKRVAVIARGDLFSVPAKDGATRDLTNTPGIHEREATWSPDGKSIAYLSDASGENEIYVRSQDGVSAPIQLTHTGDTYYFQLRWSPDSKRILWGDRKARLRFVDVATKTVTLVDTATAERINQYVWSPDGQWIAYTKPEDKSLQKIWLYSLANESRTEVTDGWYEANSPAFSEDGKYLFFASGRDFKPILSDIELNHVYLDTERVFFVTLAKKTDSPFKPKSDEVEIASDEKKPEEKKADEKKDDKKLPEVLVDVDGLKERIVGLDIKASNYGPLQAAGGKIFYVRADSEEQARATGPLLLTFASYDLKEKKETELGQVSDFEITANGKKVLVTVNKDYALLDLPTGKIDLKEKVSLGNLDMTVDRRAEWKQIYDESWRQMRDYFYSPIMNGVDWKGMHDKYATLIPYAQTRYDVGYLIGELIGEIHNSHTYAGGGDRPIAKKIQTGLLGGQFSRDPVSRAYRIDKILKGENWDDGTRSPLTEIGVNAKAGDYILAVNGIPTKDLANLFIPLVGQVGKPVVLRINGTPTEAGARDVTVIPIADEANLYYYEWVQHNTEYVSQKTGGQVGYIHIPDMGLEGLTEFTKHFYPQLRKKALVIDDRGNGGGFVSPMIVEHLRRELVMIEVGRGFTPTPNPNDMQVGPKVLLMDEFSASDGDIFPYRFRTYKLGKLIGKRSWGGVIGIAPSLPFVDGGTLNKPEFGPYAADGKSWPIEGHGVDPDIVVDNDPAKAFAGEDQQLDRGIEQVLAELKLKDPTLPPAPPYPDRSHPDRNP